MPVPSLVVLPEVVGFEESPQQTPFEVTEAPPSEVTLPPEVAEVVAMLEIAVVVTVGDEKEPYS